MIRKAIENDIDAIMEIIHDARNYLKENNIPQWQGPYPTKEIFLEDIETGNCYVLEDDDIIGVMCIFLRENDQDNEDNYDYIEDGSWLNDDPYVVIHRSAILSSKTHKGYMQQMFVYAEDYALENGVKNLRIDTHRMNQAMLKSIDRFGFQQCGIVYMYDKTERLAFQKVIS